MVPLQPGLFAEAGASNRRKVLLLSTIGRRVELPLQPLCPSAVSGKSVPQLPCRLASVPSTASAGTRRAGEMPGGYPHAGGKAESTAEPRDQTTKKAGLKTLPCGSMSHGFLPPCAGFVNLMPERHPKDNGCSQ